jgi:hypothetical protein
MDLPAVRAGTASGMCSPDEQTVRLAELSRGLVAHFCADSIDLDLWACLSCSTGTARCASCSLRICPIASRCWSCANGWLEQIASSQAEADRIRYSSGVSVTMNEMSVRS